MLEQEAHTQSREAVSKPWETREEVERISGEEAAKTSRNPRELMQRRTFCGDPAELTPRGRGSLVLDPADYTPSMLKNLLGAGQGHKKAPSMNWQGEQPAGAAAEPWTNKISLFNMKLYE